MLHRLLGMLYLPKSARPSNTSDHPLVTLSSICPVDVSVWSACARAYVCVCVCVCVRACVRACVRECVRACGMFCCYLLDFAAVVAASAAVLSLLLFLLLSQLLLQVLLLLFGFAVFRVRIRLQLTPL